MNKLSPIAEFIVQVAARDLDASRESLTAELLEDCFQCAYGDAIRAYGYDAAHTAMNEAHCAFFGQFKGVI